MQAGDYVRYSMYVSVFLDPAYPQAAPAGKRRVKYIVQSIGQYQKGEQAGSSLITRASAAPTIQDVTPVFETTDPAMIDMSQVSFEFQSTSSRSKIFVPDSTVTNSDSPELEILNFKMYPGVVLSVADFAESQVRMNLDGFPLEQRYHSTFVDTRLVSFKQMAFDFQSLMDRETVGITSAPEAFAGIFGHDPASGTGSSTIYTRPEDQFWDKEQTGFVATMWFTVNQASSILDKFALSRLRFILVTSFFI